jgi:hypothetical protein
MPTRCVTRRDVPLVFKATNRNGFGAAYTAVREKLRFPRMSYNMLMRVSDNSPLCPTSSAWTCTCGVASFKFLAMTMFAIFRVSKGLNGLGDLDVLTLLDRGVPEAGENCGLISHDLVLGSCNQHRL